LALSESDELFASLFKYTSSNWFLAPINSNYVRMCGNKSLPLHLSTHGTGLIYRLLRTGLPLQIDFRVD